MDVCDKSCSSVRPAFNNVNVGHYGGIVIDTMVLYILMPV